MRVLLDTHAFLWWVTDDPQLSSTSRSIIADSGNILFLSVASVWEIVIKTKSGKGLPTNKLPNLVGWASCPPLA
ncbi:MAG: type II toxin-antitoxin system VapC family toxin [Nostoc sp.]|uniref:type II toxin-antitoxin system VapC family toxin n=1 Tax=Nostoc sp. TaxID=1180 RepID=UPI002FFA7F20